MKAAIHPRYGPPEVLELRDVPRPAPQEGGVLVRIRAAAVNAMDWYFLTGTPYVGRLLGGMLSRPGSVLGADFAGVVEAVGGRVTSVRVGDPVFGAARGAFAEYIAVPEDRVAPKPARASFEQAAACPVAGLTALQGLRDAAKVSPGQQVLVHGASGGVGTFAVQVAKALGAEVTAVCRARRVDVARAIGADHVVDSTQEDFTRSGGRYDVLFDVAGTRSVRDCRRVMKPHGAIVIAGGPRKNRWLGPLPHLLGAMLSSLGGRANVRTFVARITRSDLEALGELLEAGRVKPVVDGVFPLDRVAEAMRWFGEGRSTGKVVLTM